MRRFLLTSLFVFWALCASVGAQNLYIICSGVSDYPGERNDLTLPARDAKAIFRLYCKNADADAVLLTNSNATKSHIISETRKLFAKAGKDDIVVFYFSGHGYPGGFHAYDEKLPYSDVRKLFAKCKAKNKMIFADACFSGDIREGDSTGHNDPDNNIMLFLSSRSNETSIESPKMKNGFFTACLLRSLKGGADINKDRIITAKELYSAVNKGVRGLSNERQHPVMWGNFEDTMPVMVWK